MNEPIDPDLREIEAELVRFRPAAVPRRLEHSIGHGLQPRRDAPAAVAGLDDPGRRAHRARLQWLVLSGAFAAAIAAIFWFRQPPASPPLPGFKPISAERAVTSIIDDGEVTLSDGTRARRYETAVVNTTTWRDPASRATLSWSAPDSEVRFIPVSYQ